MSIPHGMRTECAQNAHRMRTECAQHIMAVRIRCACAPPLYSVRNAHRHCAQPFYAVRILCACSPTSVRMRTDTSCAHSVRIAHRRLWKFYPLSVRSAPTAHRCAPLVHPPVSSLSMIIFHNFLKGSVFSKIEPFYLSVTKK